MISNELRYRYPKMKKSELRQIIKEELSKSIVENEQWSAGDVSEIMRQLLLTQKTLRNGASHMERLIEVLGKYANKPQGDKLAGMVPDNYQVIDILNKMENLNKGLHAMFPHLNKKWTHNELICYIRGVFSVFFYCLFNQPFTNLPTF